MICDLSQEMMLQSFKCHVTSFYMVKEVKVKKGRHVANYYARTQARD
jgi:hypothetical protein